MLKKLHELIAGTKAPVETEEGFKLPFGLSNDEWLKLQRWRETPEFETYIKTLDELIKFNAEALLGASTDENLHFYRGQVLGLRKAAFLVDEIKRTEEAFHVDRERSKQRERGGRSIALYGSPGWDSGRAAAGSK